MKKLIIAFITLVAFSSVSYADSRRHRVQNNHQNYQNNYRPNYQNNYRHHPHQHYRHNNSNGRWVAPLVGGLVVGGLGSYYYYNRPNRCWDEPIVDRWNRIVGYDRYCE
jgi:hypothetical protein